MNDFEDWTTSELFNYLMDHYLIPNDSEFEDWKNLRTDMLKLCQEHEQ